MLDDIYKIKRPKRFVKKVFYIVCEGESTEKLWLESIKRKHKNIEIKALGNTAICKVETLMNFYNEYEMFEQDEKLYILDLDKPQQQKENIKNIEDYINSGVNLYYSKPSFEFVVLIYAYVSSQLNNQLSIEDVINKYEKKDIEKIIKENENPRILNGKELSDYFLAKVIDDKIEQKLIKELDLIVKNIDINYENLNLQNVNKIIDDKRNFSNIYVLLQNIRKEGEL